MKRREIEDEKRIIQGHRLTYIMKFSVLNKKKSNSYIKIKRNKCFFREKPKYFQAFSFDSMLTPIEDARTRHASKQRKTENSQANCV